MTEDEIYKHVVDCAIKVHRALGPGLLESAYEACLVYELETRGLIVDRQKSIPVNYNGINIDCGYRLDLLIEQKVVVELKAVESLNDIHLAQILTYLKLADCKLGLLINFNVLLLKNGIKRVINSKFKKSDELD